MGEEKKTIMVLKVDLECPCCYKKVKKVLCKFPQIRDQVFDEKANTVTIVVMCCSPEKLRDKLCCKGGKAIKSIDIKDSPKPKEPEKPKVPEKPKEPEKPKVFEKPKEPEKPKLEKPKEPEKPKEAPKPKEPEKPKVTFVEPEKPSKPSKPAPEPGIIRMPCPVDGYPPPTYPQGYPGGPCCEQCYNGFGGGPCYQGQGYGRPVPPPPGPSYDGYGYGGYRPCYASRCCDNYFNEENPSGCSVM